MTSKKILKMTRGFADKRAREEFLRLPRAEFLIEDLNKRGADEIGKMVVNSTMDVYDRYSMQVDNERMAGCGIKTGDFVVIQPKNRYHDNDVVAVKVGDQVFLRRYFQNGNRIRLEGSNSRKQTMILDVDTPGFSVLGSVVQVIREL